MTEMQNAVLKWKEYNGVGYDSFIKYICGDPQKIIDFYHDERTAALEILGRGLHSVQDIDAHLQYNDGDPNRATIFVGARGSGKTVLLAKIADEASANGWIGANVNAAQGMLDEVLVQIRDNAKEFLTHESLSHNIKATWRSEMTSMVKEINEKNIGVFVTVDELDVKIDELRTLVTTFQHFVRERRDVALIMAGLPPKVSNLLRDDSISFLRRAFQHHLEAIDESEVRFSMKRTIERAGRTIEKDALSLAAENAKGFPFMIQLIGYHMWRQHPEKKSISLDDAAEGIVLAQSGLLLADVSRIHSKQGMIMVCKVVEKQG
ncbi:MAG: P-loop NTPase fold protein [Clostridiales bacterium]|nr:P-loop NTPase fold protein [Clostridiales bacterium]